MSEVLGHDCAGKPLRGGDRVEVIQAHDTRPEYVGLVCTVTGRAGAEAGLLATYGFLTGVAVPWVEIDGRGFCGTEKTFKRIDDHDQPADCSFHELLQDLKTSNPSEVEAV